MGVLRDLQDNQSWKYDELSPVQMLEKLKLDKRLANRDELERAEFFWARRPRFLRAIFWPVCLTCGSWTDILAIPCPGHRSAAVATIRGIG